MNVTDTQNAFLRAHRWALISTTGRAGGPQVSMVAYAWDGVDLVISTRRSAVKWANLARHPLAAVTVTDDQRCLTVYGRAALLEHDPEREALTRRVQSSLLPDHAALLEQDFVTGLEATGRVVIRLVPERAVGRI
jgi:PPOX class probable F420-dependent enzyme